MDNKKKQAKHAAAHTAAHSSDHTAAHSRSHAHADSHAHAESKVHVESVTHAKQSAGFKDILRSFSKKLVIFAVFDMIFFIVSLVIAYSLTKLYELMVSRWVTMGTLALNAPKEKILAGSIAIYVLSSVLTLAAYIFFTYLAWKKATGSGAGMKKIFPFTAYGVLTHLFMLFTFFLLFVFIKGLSSLNNVFLLIFGVLVFIAVLFYISVYYAFSMSRFFESVSSSENMHFLYLFFDTVKFSFAELRRFLLPFAILLISFVGLSFVATMKEISSRNYLLFLFVFIYLAIYKSVYCMVLEHGKDPVKSA